MRRSAHFTRFLRLSVALALLAGAGAVQAGGLAGPPHGFFVQVVRPGQSIQAALDRAAEGGWVFVLLGTYRESANTTNGLNITRGVHLIGMSLPWGKVVLESTGTQRNGIVAVPAEHTECMSCHASLAPPFDLKD